MITTKTFTAIVSDAVTAVQGAAQQLLDLSVGSVIRAFLEATSGITLWLQAIALQIAARTRFATSNGEDADSWAADYGFPRQAAKAATSPQVTVGRFTSTQQALMGAATQNGTDSTGLPVWTGGSIVQTQDGTQQYFVVPDTTQPAYSTALNAYVIPAGTPSVSISIQASVAGSAGNVGAGIISALGTSVPGVDFVSNDVALTNGADAESDTAFKARFPLYINSLAKGTPPAIKAAIGNIQQNVFKQLTENESYPGTVDKGYFYAVVDDGTGAPTSDFISTVFNTVDQVRPIGATFGVFAPVLIPANITMSLTLAPGYDQTDVDGLVTDALQAYLGSLEIGETLPYTRLSQIAYDASPGITNVTGVTLNSGTADLAVNSKSVIRAGTLAIA